MTGENCGTFLLPGGLGLSIMAEGSGEVRRKLLRARWAHYIAALDGPANLEFHLGKFSPEIPDHARIVDKDYHIADQYLYHHGSRGGRGQTEIVPLEGEDHICLRHQPYPEMFPFSLSAGVRGMNMYLDPMMAWWYSRKGMTLLHAAAIEREGKTWLLAGANGTGKTRLVLELCHREGFSFLADDLLIVRGREVMGIVEHPAVLALRWAEFLRSGKARCSRRAILQHILRNRQPNFGDLEIIPSGRLEGLVFLEKPVGQDGAIRRNSPETLWMQAIRLEHLELNRYQRRHWQVSNFGRFLMAYEYGVPGSAIFDTLQYRVAAMPQQWQDMPAWTITASAGLDAKAIREIF